MGDLNIHLDNTTHPHTRITMQTLESCNLTQHVDESTHYCGHTLDVLIGQHDSTLISACEVIDIGLCDNNGDLMNSHYGITCELACHMKQSNSKQVTLRKLKSIDVTKFRTDIHTSPSLSDTTGSADDMIERYSERLTSILDIHAPIIHRIVIPRPSATWYTSSLHTAKRKRRTLEQRWRRSRKQTDRVA